MAPPPAASTSRKTFYRYCPTSPNLRNRRRGAAQVPRQVWLTPSLALEPSPCACSKRKEDEPIAIRHRSVKVDTTLLLFIEGEHLSDTQEVRIIAKGGVALLVRHANGWLRSLTAASPDVRTYTDPSAPASMTFRLLEIA
jgi:hypothetical protein